MIRGPYQFAKDTNARDLVREILAGANPSRIAKTRMILEALDEHFALTGREVVRREEAPDCTTCTANEWDEAAVHASTSQIEGAA